MYLTSHFTSNQVKLSLENFTFVCLVLCVFSSEFRIVGFGCGKPVFNRLLTFCYLKGLIKSRQGREDLFVKTLSFRVWCYRLSTDDDPF